MHSASIAGGRQLAYEDDSFVAPWLDPGSPVVLLHGVAETSKAWVQWMPKLVGVTRVLRLDLPGYGASTAPEDYDWTPLTYAHDVLDLLDVLAIEKAHVVGAKYGGTIALQLACVAPERVATLSLFSTPVGTPRSDTPERVRRDGVLAWARASGGRRLGSTVSAEQARWWSDELMGVADERAVLGCTAALRQVGIQGDLADVSAPTLVVTTSGSSLQDVATVREYQQRIPNSTLEAWPSDCYHPAAVLPDRCATRVLEWIAG